MRRMTPFTAFIRIFHHLCSTQIYLGSLEPQNNHVISSTLHIASVLDDVLNTIHDHGFHHHIFTLPLHNLTPTHVFCSSHCTLTAMEWETYKESDLRLVNHISPPTPTLPVSAPSTPTTESMEISVLSPSSTTLTLFDEPADPHPEFHQNCTASYPTQVVSQDPHLGPPMVATEETVCFHCHTLGHVHVNCPDYECPHCRQHAPRHPQYWCLCNNCSFCQHFSHLSRYCLDRWCALCDNLKHVIADCPFSEDPSAGVIFNNTDPEGLWYRTGGTTLWRG